MMSKKTGILLLNLGTPDAPTSSAIRRYLRTFLSDRRVVSLPRLIWYPILYGVILPFRPRIIVERYRSIWGEIDAPIREIGAKQKQKLEKTLALLSDSSPLVEIGMTYGFPSITNALDNFTAAGIERLIILPLFPQFASSSTAASFDAVSRAFASRNHIPELLFINEYHNHPLYIEALANSIRRHWENTGRQGKLLMSFHGIPVDHVDKGDPYQQQCEMTARLVAEKLQLSSEQWLMSYQSRPGKGQWLQPYTEEVVTEWGKEALEAVDVICPGFSADCLETLEEIAVQNCDFFKTAGGGDFQYIPALNDSEPHIELLAKLCLETTLINTKINSDRVLMERLKN